MPEKRRRGKQRTGNLELAAQYTRGRRAHEIRTRADGFPDHHDSEQDRRDCDDQRPDKVGKNRIADLTWLEEDLTQEVFEVERGRARSGQKAGAWSRSLLIPQYRSLDGFPF